MTKYISQLICFWVCKRQINCEILPYFCGLLWICKETLKVRKSQKQIANLLIRWFHELWIYESWILHSYLKVFNDLDYANERASPSYLLAHKFVHLRPNQLSEDCYSQCLTSEWDPWLEWNILFNHIRLSSMYSNTYLIQNRKLFMNFKHTYMDFITINAIFVTWRILGEHKI